MADTELLHEVEQAMLGAMISRPLRVGGLPSRVSPDLFTDQRHQAIAAALTGTAGSERGLLGRLRGFFARFSRRTREDQAYLDTLPGLCPDAGHMASYFDILSQARDQREARAREAMAQAADAAKVLRGAADQLAVQTGGAGRAVAPDELSADAARQARALARHAQRLSQLDPSALAERGRRRQLDRALTPSPVPAPASVPQNQLAARGAVAPQAANGRAASGPGRAGQQAGGPVLSAPPSQSAQAAPSSASASVTPASGSAAVGRQGGPDGVRPAASSGGTGAGAPASVSRKETQELLLGALMRDPEFAREVVESLPATLFDGGERRELFTLIGEHVSKRRPMDPLIMAWTADQRTSAGPDGERTGWITSDYVRGVAALPPAPGRPSWLVQLLLNDVSGASVPERSPDQSTSQVLDQASGQSPDQVPVQTQSPAPSPAQPSVPEPDSAPSVDSEPRPMTRAETERTAAPVRGTPTTASPAPSVPDGSAPQPAPDPDAPVGYALAPEVLMEPPPTAPEPDGVTPTM